MEGDFTKQFGGNGAIALTGQYAAPLESSYDTTQWMGARQPEILAWRSVGNVAAIPKSPAENFVAGRNSFIPPIQVLGSASGIDGG